MKIACIALLTIFMLGCGGYGNNMGGMGGSNPRITGFDPTSAVANGPAFVLTINGSGFGTDSVVFFNATAHTTHYATAGQVTADITADDIANSGMVPVYVRTGGTNSNTMNFPVN